MGGCLSCPFFMLFSLALRELYQFEYEMSYWIAEYFSLIQGEKL